MTAMHAQAIHPGGDERYKAIDRTIRRCRAEKDALLEVLTTAQETFGFLSKELLTYVSGQLRVPLSQVYGVATFYHMFTFDPLGENNLVICSGTACHVKGAGQIEQALAAEYNIRAGETTPDGQISISKARCLGSCGLAPVVVINGEIRGKETSESVKARVSEIVAQVTSNPKA
jgi:bidirectional [NiFe] hydrogenase diaphorase subunit